MAKVHPKKKIPKAMREQIWLRDFGKEFEAKCKTPWCINIINVWDFQAGHNIPESKGGTLDPSNLVPLCSRCNLSMSNTYSFDEWAYKAAPPAQVTPTIWCC